MMKIIYFEYYRLKRRGLSTSTFAQWIFRVTSVDLDHHQVIVLPRTFYWKNDMDSICEIYSLHKRPKLHNKGPS